MWQLQFESSLAFLTMKGFQILQLQSKLKTVAIPKLKMLIATVVFTHALAHVLKKTTFGQTGSKVQQGPWHIVLFASHSRIVTRPRKREHRKRAEVLSCWAAITARSCLVCKAAFAKLETGCDLMFSHDTRRYRKDSKG